MRPETGGDGARFAKILVRLRLWVTKSRAKGGTAACPPFGTGAVCGYREKIAKEENVPPPLCPSPSHLSEHERLSRFSIYSRIDSCYTSTLALEATTS